jgi:hypothetical protein
MFWPEFHIPSDYGSSPFSAHPSQRTQLGILVDTGEAREVHHFCALVGFGADGICPYLAIEAIMALNSEGRISTTQEFTREELVARYFKSSQDGMLKVGFLIYFLQLFVLVFVLLLFVLAIFPAVICTGFFSCFYLY